MQDSGLRVAFLEKELAGSLHHKLQFMSPTAPPSNPPIEPDRVAVPAQLDPAAALAFRTPLHEHVLSADGKAAGVITLLGMMFTVVARFGSQLSDLVQAHGPARYAVSAFVLAFAALALGAVVQAFRTISPRFPAAPPSLAFFGDIARLERDEYVRRVEALSADEALQHMLSYNHTGSLICIEKARQLRRGLRFFEGAAACWAVIVVILVVRTFLPW
jgi:hypothetical protein